MKYLYIFLLITLPAVCQNIDRNDVAFKGTIPLNLTLKDFELVYKDYVIVDPLPGIDTCDTPEETNVKALRYDGVTYILDEGLLNFVIIKFFDRYTGYLLYKGIRFDKNLQLEEFIKKFPASKKESEDQFRPLGTIVNMSMPSSIKNEAWHFHFLNNKLYVIQYIFSCK